MILGLLLVYERRHARWEGQVGCAFGLLYGLSRFSLDLLRDDLRRFGLTGSQWAALAVVMACGVLLARGRTARAGPNGTDSDGRSQPAIDKTDDPFHPSRGS